MSKNFTSFLYIDWKLFSLYTLYKIWGSVSAFPEGAFIMLKKMLGTILGILILVLGIVCYVKLQTPATGEKVDGYLLSTSEIGRAHV